MIEGMLLGILGAVISFFIIESCYLAVLSAMGSIPAGTIIELKKFGEIWHLILLPFIALGVLIGAAGSALSIRKYLRV